MGGDSGHAQTLIAKLSLTGDDTHNPVNECMAMFRQLTWRDCEIRLLCSFNAPPRVVTSQETDAQ